MSARAAFRAEDTHGIALRAGNRLIADSDGLGWSSIYASFAQERPWADTVPAIDHPGIAVSLRHPTRVRRHLVGTGERLDAELAPRQFSVLPARVPAFWRIEGQPHILLVYLHGRVLDEVAEQVFDADPATVELLPRLAVHDPFVEQLARRILDALVSRDPDCTGLYADTLAHALAAHLVHRHSSRTRHAPPPASGSPAALRRAVEFIEANLSQPLPLHDIAQAAGLTPLYFIRAFRRRHGETPHQYVLRRRVERAEQMIQASDLTNAEIALATGFSSQSHFCTVFRKIVGMTPTAYRDRASV